MQRPLRCGPSRRRAAGLRGNTCSLLALASALFLRKAEGLRETYSALELQEDIEVPKHAEGELDPQEKEDSWLQAVSAAAAAAEHAVGHFQSSIKEEVRQRTAATPVANMVHLSPTEEASERAHIAPHGLWGVISKLAALQRSSCGDTHTGHLVGCRQGCTCAWHQQCFPKRMLGGSDDIGICSTSMNLLVLSSLTLIMAVFASVVVLRLFLQHQQYLRERQEHEVTLHKLSCKNEKAPQADQSEILGTTDSVLRFDRKGRQKDEWESASEAEEETPEQEVERK